MVYPGILDNDNAVIKILHYVSILPASFQQAELPVCQYHPAI